jgi:hypothetical protein
MRTFRIVAGAVPALLLPAAVFGFVRTSRVPLEPLRFTEGEIEAQLVSKHDADGPTVAPELLRSRPASAQ